MRLKAPMNPIIKTVLLFFTCVLICFWTAWFLVSGGTQGPKVNFPDSSGAQYKAVSDNLDVPYVPTPMKVVRTLLDMASVGPGDFLIDLGSGDGRIVITAAKEYGARGFGVDLNNDLVALSKTYAVDEGVQHKVDFFVRDIFKTDIRGASVITMYLLNEINLQMRPRLLADLKPGTRIISHDFHLGDWRPDKMVRLDVNKYYQDDTILYLWIVPAKVAGNWRWHVSLSEEKELSFDLELSQIYQHVSGMARNLDYTLPIFDAELKGDRIQFSVFGEVDERMVRQDYQGRIQGNRIVGTVQLKGLIRDITLKWQATRE